MTELDTFIRSDQELMKAVRQIRDDQWDMTLPPDFPTRDQKPYTLRQIMTYQAYDEAWIPAMVEGKTMDEAGKDAFGGPFDNELLGESPKEDFERLVEKSIAAVRACSEGDLNTRTVHYSYGDYPLREALWHAILFRAMRAYDIAKATGGDANLSPELVTAVWDIVEPHAEEWRAFGVLGPNVDVPDDTPLQDRLLGLTGRKP